MNLYFLGLISTSEKEKKEKMNIQNRKIKIRFFSVNRIKLDLFFVVGDHFAFQLKKLNYSFNLSFRIGLDIFCRNELEFKFVIDTIDRFSPLKMNLIKRNIIGFYNMI